MKQGLNNDPPTQNDTTYLPGYEAQLSTSGVHHSIQKLQLASQELTSTSSSPEKDGTIVETIIYLPCSSEEETIGYRCCCSFQILTRECKTTQRVQYCYAMRHAKTAMAIESDSFPIATPRIQNVMKSILHALNDHDGTNPFENLGRDLTSISFASSWHEEGACIVTLNYSIPLPRSSCDGGDSSKKWHALQLEGRKLCTSCSITSLMLRSKKRQIVLGQNPPYLLDCLLLQKSAVHDSPLPRIQFSLVSPDKMNLLMEQEEEMVDGSSSLVIYHKPHDAFQHPNSNTMLQALHWMMDTLQNILSNYSSKRTPLNLLEMYCGCGAHTMAIAKAGLFDSIVAVELDQRLVDACSRNCHLNGVDYKDGTDLTVREEHKEGDHPVGEDTRKVGLNCDRTTVYPFQGDAGRWASKYLRTTTSTTTQKEPNVQNQSYWYAQSYQVLLVDPPRMGLDENVRNLAIHGPFDHIIYVSCGRNALKRDLVILGKHFDVMDCVLTDLFPRTDSVETLVHLRRKHICSS